MARLLRSLQDAVGKNGKPFAKLSVANKHLKDYIRKCKEDIHFFAVHGLNASPTWQQATILDMVQAAVYGPDLAPRPRIPDPKGPGEPAGFVSNTKAHRQIAVKSGQGPGKTHASTIVALWRAIQQPGKTVVTAPTMRQCQEVWLGEAKKVIYKAHPYWQSIFDVTATKIIVAKNRNWAILCITSTDEKKLQGMHDDGLTILVEEASGVESRIIEQFQGTLSNNDCLLVMIGNPNLRECKFFDCFNIQRKDWQTYTLNAEETARWRPDILSPRRNELLAEQYGRDSDVYRVRVLGEFPHADPNTVISSEQLEKAAANSRYECALINSDQRAIAIDFARFGSDETVIYRKQGNAIVEQQIFVKIEPADAVRAAFRMQTECGWSNGDCWYIPDATGMGQGVMHMFYEAGKQVFEFHNGSKAYRQDRYKNRITEAWFHLAEMVRKQKVFIPPDNRLIAQLSGRLYKTDEKTGQLVVEKKDEFVKRLEEDSSPDRADACVMAFYNQFLARGLVASKGPSERGMSRVWR